MHSGQLERCLGIDGKGNPCNTDACLAKELGVNNSFISKWSEVILFNTAGIQAFLASGNDKLQLLQLKKLNKRIDILVDAIKEDDTKMA